MWIVREGLRMGDQESINERHATAFQQGLELLDRGALLVAESSPQIAEHWDQVEGRLQRMEANVLTLQNSVDRIQAQLERVEDELKRLREKDRLREMQLSALQTNIDKAVNGMFPRVDALLTQIESTKRVFSVKEEQIESTEKVNSVKEEEIVIASSSSDNVNTVVTSQFSSNSYVESSRCLPLQQVTSFSSSLLRPGPIFHPRPTSHPRPISHPRPTSHPRPISHPQPIQTFPNPHYQNWDARWVVGCDNALLDAAKKGRSGDIPNLLAAGANINPQNVEQRTPLMLESYECHAIYLSMLQHSGLNAVFGDKMEILPLHAAATNGHESAVRVLLEAGVDVNKRDGITGSTALILAASKGHSDFVSTLLRNNANMEVQDDDGMTALHRAVLHSHARCVSLLLEGGADVNCLDKRGRTPRDYANRSGTQEVLGLFVCEERRLYASGN